VRSGPGRKGSIYRWEVEAFAAMVGGMFRVIGEVLSIKPLQRRIPPQEDWCNINEPLVRRACS
jgi:hypothetical protein